MQIITRKSNRRLDKVTKIVGNISNNQGDIAIIETKHKAHVSDVEKLINKNIITLKNYILNTKIIINI
jgi:predicted GTPase